MGGAKQRATTTAPPHPRAPTVIPAQAGTPHPPTLPRFPNSSLPLLGGRLGGGCEATSHRRRSFAPPIAHAAPRPPHARLSPTGIPAPPHRHSCAGRNPRAPKAPSQSTPSPIHPSPLLGGRLGGGCGAPSHRRRSFAPPIIHAAPPIAHAAPPTATARIVSIIIPAPPLPSFLRRQEWWVRRSGRGGRPALARNLPPPT